MELEILKRGTYNKNNQDFSKSEGSWENIEWHKAVSLVESNYKTMEMSRPKEDLSAFKWDSIEVDLENGRVIPLLKGFLRKRTEQNKCPYCGSSINNPALSRRGNEVEICSECGRREATEDLGEFRGD